MDILKSLSSVVSLFILRLFFVADVLFVYGLSIILFCCVVLYEIIVDKKKLCSNILQLIY